MADLVTKAKRALERFEAAELGMDVMVDFHYSDWWADPGQQHKPAAWKRTELGRLEENRRRTILPMYLMR